MYEIWLVINILWEIALGLWPVLLLVAVTWAFLVLRAFTRGAAWQRSLGLALVIGVGVALLLIPVVPGAVGSSLADMGYWVDWVNLLAICAGFGAAAFALAWPLLAQARVRSSQ
ncbi:hypothetical protein [Hydrogenophaga atypica]|uniref:Transmembrane protein n=1 Tax=Hydrogenophaga atypica TaxID=249409 RepID=A0ABW2QRE8_9BURK